MNMNKSQTSPSERSAEIERILVSAHRRSRYRRWLLLLFLLLLIVGLGYYWRLPRNESVSAAVRYRTEPATIGTLVVKVSATGNLEPTNQVDVGSELSGIVEKVYVDVNDNVMKNQVLAELDKSKLRDAITMARAGLASAEAQVLQAQATVTEARANLSRFRHVAELSGGKVPSKSEIDTAEATLKRAEANEAAAKAAVIQAKAELQSNETNLYKADIRSPIDGVVLNRQIDPGQTVAASFQAPVLFVLAEDLSKMEVEVDVDEANVGQVAVGQQASFTVDAWPGRQYSGVITRVSYGSEVTEGVVSYPTRIQVTNDDLSLRPGMTVTADITTLTRENALLVPNAALRVTPPEANTTPKKSRRSLVSTLLPRPPAQTPKARTVNNNGTPRVWVLRNGEAVSVDVKIGAANDRVTEIVGGEIEAGTEIITEFLDTTP